MVGAIPVKPKPEANVGFAVCPGPPAKVDEMANVVLSAGVALLMKVSNAALVLVIVQVTAKDAAVPLVGMVRPEKAIANVAALVTTPPLEATIVPSPLVHCQNILNIENELLGANESSPKVTAPLATGKAVVVPPLPTLAACTTPFCSKSNL